MNHKSDTDRIAVFELCQRPLNNIEIVPLYICPATENTRRVATSQGRHQQLVRESDILRDGRIHAVS